MSFLTNNAPVRAFLNFYQQRTKREQRLLILMGLLLLGVVLFYGYKFYQNRPTKAPQSTTNNAPSNTINSATNDNTTNNNTTEPETLGDLVSEFRDAAEQIPAGNVTLLQPSREEALLPPLPLWSNKSVYNLMAMIEQIGDWNRDGLVYLPKGGWGILILGTARRAGLSVSITKDLQNGAYEVAVSQGDFPTVINFMDSLAQSGLRIDHAVLKEDNARIVLQDQSVPPKNTPTKSQKSSQTTPKDTATGEINNVEGGQRTAAPEPSDPSKP